MRYALVENNVVVNVILWNGDGDLYCNYKTIQLSNLSDVGPGDLYDEDLDKFTSKESSSM